MIVQMQSAPRSKHKLQRSEGGSQTCIMAVHHFQVIIPGNGPPAVVFQRSKTLHTTSNQEESQLYIHTSNTLYTDV